MEYLLGGQWLYKNLLSSHHLFFCIGLHEGRISLYDSEGLVGEPFLKQAQACVKGHMGPWEFICRWCLNM